MSPCFGSRGSLVFRYILKLSISNVRQALKSRDGSGRLDYWCENEERVIKKQPKSSFFSLLEIEKFTHEEMVTGEKKSSMGRTIISHGDCHRTKEFLYGHDDYQPRRLSKD
ncbi:hypothetical protein PoB_005769100 [Plakobranchus ocellatus]|uniref:Uncharacterized protein n=1 Tax=Plakobranchus ocellatus TaxID=259542 RepID=A0AAV4CI96_9GAST|nr:hypothetical protein PoB_005769100 [Plakobranchus ocellatus]